MILSGCRLEPHCCDGVVHFVDEGFCRVEVDIYRCVQAAVEHQQNQLRAFSTHERTTHHLDSLPHVLHASTTISLPVTGRADFLLPEKIA